jgi:galactose-1-phosphate uridylyltransferase
MALKLPGQDTYLYDWNMEYYVNVNDQKASFRTSSVEEMVNLWLVDHHGEIILWNGGSRPEKDYRVVAYKKHPSNYPKRYM